MLINTPTHSIVPNVSLADTSRLDYIYPEKKTVSKNFKKDKKWESEKINYKPFNPNDYQKADWQNIGFSAKQAAVIVNYKKQINGFKSVEDVKACFVIDDDKFNALKSYLRFPKQTYLVEDSSAVIQSVITLVDLNQANQTELETVSGIGPFFSEKIVELREKLGGFYHVNQLKDIYGMTAENFDRIQDKLVANSNTVRKIDLKSAEFKDLKKHPYINWKQAQVLTALTDKSISPKFWQNLQENDAFSATDIEKLKPYLK